ncbi:hypothetical protein BV497_00700 [Fulvimonas soli]|uniref:Glycolate oxidase iron-sulfur subunit n=2 Tax=Fulvimonas soli TaxID=155197 RepID=A0A316HKU5_9GAMM|nr:glycolate oxidase iron-sulfur subunit [Fulvimonas soli]TNY27995.1 hypothetical protein BV497_00700 [Fulvimonas soli]
MPAMALEKTPGSLAALADQCVQCGLCLPACPTYALDASETESPRGRIALAKALAEGRAAATPALRAPLDHCLGCLACERVCPAQVRYGELLVRTRALLGPAPGRPRRLLGLLKRPALLRPLRRACGRLARAAPARRLARRLPEAWRAALALLPAGAATAAAEPCQPSPRPAVALFPGCVASVEDAEAQRALLALLRAAGIEAAVLPAFCCGALDAHGGEAAAAAAAARRVRQAWEASGAGQLLTATPGCLGTLRQALPGVAVGDAWELLDAHAGRLRFRPLPVRAALHLPCTQANVARSGEAMRRLLARVPGLELLPLDLPHCCGAAGSHLLEFPARAARLREPALRRLAALAPARLLSSNIGCRLHLAAGLAAEGRALPTQHPLTLLAQQLLPETDGAAP